MPACKQSLLKDRDKTPGRCSRVIGIHNIGDMMKK
jgi:hypothetical protein